MGGPRGANTGQRNPSPGGGRGGNGPQHGPQGSGRSDGNRFDAPRDGRGGAAQPDPMKTAFGYIGADSFTRQRQDAGQRPAGSPGGQRRKGRNK